MKESDTHAHTHTHSISSVAGGRKVCHLINISPIRGARVCNLANHTCAETIFWTLEVAPWSIPSGVSEPTSTLRGPHTEDLGPLSVVLDHIWLRTRRSKD